MTREHPTTARSEEDDGEPTSVATSSWDDYNRQLFRAADAANLAAEACEAGMVKADLHDTSVYLNEMGLVADQAGSLDAFDPSRVRANLRDQAESLVRIAAAVPDRETVPEPRLVQGRVDDALTHLWRAHAMISAIEGRTHA